MIARFRRGLWRLLVKVLLIFVIAGFTGGGLLILWLANLKIPDFDALDDRLVVESTKIYDRTGEVLLYNVQDQVKRQVVPYDQISKHVKNATVAIEDDEFYEHNGFKPAAFLRALLVNISAGDFKQGGSTITQQLIKNSLLTQDKKITRKIKEIFLALKIEQVLSKEEILALYLNEAPYGGNIYGIEEASQHFFNKPASALGLGESAYLAAIPKAPTYYSPYGNNVDKLEARKNLVLGRMVELGFITPVEHSAAREEEVEFQPPSTYGIKAPHFVIWVRDQLEKKYGAEAVRTKGFKVITTLDWELQEKAEELAQRYGETNEKNFNADNLGLVAIDPATGQILTMVGSRDYFNVERNGNFNVTLAHRQPGSAFKPFVYATAFNKGLTPETVVFDLPTQFDTACSSDASKCYSPSNYDGLFRGPISLRQALAQSINVAAIKVLYLAGIDDALRTARTMGIESLGSAAQYGLTLVLGGGEVSLLDLTGAYGIFASEGLKHPRTGLLRVEDAAGNILEEFKERPSRALPENTARLISSILSDNAARAPIFGLNSQLFFPGRDVAVKTGTTNDYRDAWTVGYTPNFAAGAWVGNNDNSPMERRLASMISTPLWREFMNFALAKRPPLAFTPPAPIAKDLKPVLRGFWRGNQTYTVDKISGKLATENTPEELREERAITEVHSLLHWLSRDDILGPPPSNPGRDPQYRLWEGPVRAWALARGIRDGADPIPTEHDDVHVSGRAPKVDIESPQAGDRLSTDKIFRVEVEIDSAYPVTQVNFFLDNNYIGSVSSRPYRLLIDPKQFAPAAGTASQLTVVAYDQVRNRGEDSVSIRWRD